MAYQQFHLIEDEHYNVFATGSTTGAPAHLTPNINTVWGTGFGDSGYGQSTTLTPVSAGQVVTAAQWSTLISRLNSLLVHQSGGSTGITLPTTSSIISYISTLQTHINNAYGNRLNFNNIRGSQSVTNYDATWNAPLPSTFQQVRTVTFASADAARYFFNAGGRIGITLSVPSGGSDNAKEISWSNLLANGVGTLNLDATTSSRTGSAHVVSINGSSIGFWDLTSTGQTLIRVADTSAAYTSNYVEILASISGAAGANGGIGNVITFTINYNDLATDLFNDSITMVVRARVDIIPPETTYLSDTWGTVTSAATIN